MTRTAVKTRSSGTPLVDDYVEKFSTDSDADIMDGTAVTTQLHLTELLSKSPNGRKVIEHNKAMSMRCSWRTPSTCWLG
jgi:hypothetical protein